EGEGLLAEAVVHGLHGRVAAVVGYGLLAGEGAAARVRLGFAELAVAEEGQGSEHVLPGLAADLGLGVALGAGLLQQGGGDREAGAAVAAADLQAEVVAALVGAVVVRRAHFAAAGADDLVPGLKGVAG